MKKRASNGQQSAPIPVTDPAITAPLIIDTATGQQAFESPAPGSTSPSSTHTLEAPKRMTCEQLSDRSVFASNVELLALWIACEARKKQYSLGNSAHRQKLLKSAKAELQPLLYEREGIDANAAESLLETDFAEAMEQAQADAQKAKQEAKAQAASDSANDDPNPALFGEGRLAKLFFKRHAEDMRFSRGPDDWYVFNGKIWEPDGELQVKLFSDQWTEKLSNDVQQEFPDSFYAKELARQVTSAHTIGALERLSRHHAQFDHSKWNCNHETLVAGDGVYDLRTGKKHDFQRDDNSTHMTHIVPAPEGTHCPGDACPAWTKILFDSTSRYPELRPYLKRWVGYMLTGLTWEQALFMLLGPGGAGKGAFKNTVLKLLGGADLPSSYATLMKIDALMDTKFSNSTTSYEIAKLFGRRLAVTVEPPSGKVWNDGIIKELTGSDPLSGRGIYQSPFNFVPTHKLMVLANNFPKLRIVGRAERRRFQIIPFDSVVEHPDLTLEDRKLPKELGAVLRWAMGGAKEWFENGTLDPPAIVIGNSHAILDEQDIPMMWAEDRLEFGPASFDLTYAEMMESYEEWRKAHTEPLQLGKEELANALLRREGGGVERKTGIRRENSSSNRGLSGVRLRRRVLGADGNLTTAA